MEGYVLFNNRYSKFFFWIGYMRRWYIIYLINFWSNRRRSHYKETFNNSNWLSWRFCFFFILIKFIRENTCKEFWRKKYCGAGHALQISRSILIVLGKGSGIERKISIGCYLYGHLKSHFFHPSLTDLIGWKMQVLQ